MSTQILLRRGVELQWLTSGKVLDQGEPGYATDTKQFKIGNGSSLWSALPLTNSSIITGGTGINVVANGLTFTISSTGSTIGVTGGTGISVTQSGSTFTISSLGPTGDNLIINSSNTRISIGNGSTGQPLNTTILNATGNQINMSGPTGAFYLAPVRYIPNLNIPTGFFITAFNPTTSELIYWGSTGASYTPPGSTGSNVTFTINLPAASTITFNSVASQTQINPALITSVNWGDGSTSINGGVHTYNASGTYTINVIGGFTQFPTDPSFTPYITNVASFTGVIDMSYMFLNNTTFNQDISAWNTSNIANMSYMFSGASAFNRNISSWDTGNVVNMAGMFQGATIFNSNIGAWNTFFVTNMSAMFKNASAFNQNITLWKTNNVINMSEMFMNCVAFNQNINTSSDIWNTSNVTNMSGMFSGASAFNGNISLWDTSNIVNMSSMFGGASAFNRNISSWNTSNVTNMSSMFSGASAFNSSINTSGSIWNTSKVTDMSGMFDQASVFNQPIGAWNTSNVTTMRSMFTSASAFNQNVSTWNVSVVTDFYLMFRLTSMSSTNTANYINILYRKDELRLSAPLFFQFGYEGAEPGL